MGTARSSGSTPTVSIPPPEIAALIAPLALGADAVRGSRFRQPTGYRAPWGRRLGQRVLSFLLGLLVGAAVSDPTSGFWAFGPKALRLLSEHYPTGYSEPELSLLLARSRLHVQEVSVPMRPRQGGKTTLTPGPAMGALARAVLAMLIVPLRAPPKEEPGD